MAASVSHRRVSDKEVFCLLRKTLAFFLRLQDYSQTNRMYPRTFNSGTSFFFVKNGCEKTKILPVTRKSIMEAKYVNP